MKKFFFLIAVLALCGQVINAKSITVEQAKAIAQQHSSQKFMSSNNKLVLNYVGRSLKGTNDYYVFNRDGGNGFVIVSGDDAVAPILGYSDKGSFDFNQAPEYLQYLLGEYQKSLESIRNNPQKFQGSTPVLRYNPEGVTPLLDNIYGEHPHWDQFEPYNNYCPNTTSGRAYAGCAPIAFAHIMKYHQHPYRGIGENTYTYLLNNQPMTVTSNLANHIYKYSNMKNSYKSTSSGWQDLATLIFDIGVAFNTRYSTNSSDASYKDIVKGMIAHFDYNPDIQFLLKTNYADQTWREMIYNEIDESRPVYYFGYRTIANNGAETHTGHAFVMDGYDSEGKVRVIWGFQQDEYNSYFDFSLLSPRIYGTAPYENDEYKEGFNADQGAIIGICPDTTDRGGVVQKAVNLVQDTMPASDIRASIDVQALSGKYAGTLRYGIVSKSTSSSGTVSYSTMYSFTTDVDMADAEVKNIDLSGAYPYLSEGQTYYIVVWSPYFPNNYDWNWFLAEPVPFTVGDWVTPPDPQFLLGDVNRDGKLSIADVTALINLLLSNAEYDEVADVNQDGKMSIADVTALINILLSMPAE